jgi:hypothetical protein
VLEQREAAQHLAGMAHERLQERELLGAQLERLAAPPGAVAGRVEPQVADLEHRRALDRAAARERAQACQQLVERERLGEVVIGAGVEAVDPVRHGGARGQHQHRRPHALGAQPAADLEPVEVGEHRVEDDRVVLGRPGASPPCSDTSTARPARVSPRRSTSAIFRSSSTTSTRTRRAYAHLVIRG